MNNLYPLKFQAICKDKVWGGQKLKQFYNKAVEGLPNCGESWEISGIKGDMSVVSNGFLEENDLGELIEIYMGELLGDKVFDQYGEQFPLLVKMIDTEDALSVQVHPDDAMAGRLHQSLGKEEMWYVLEAGPGAEIIAGFNQEVTKELFLEHLEKGTLKSLMNVVEPRPGDVFHIKPGCIHAIGKNITLIEIQQSSDVTYRIYDWDRPGSDGKPRELHLEQGLQALDYAPMKEPVLSYVSMPGVRNPLVEAASFTVNLLEMNEPSGFDYSQLDSFVILSVAEGKIRLHNDDFSVEAVKGESILIPAECDSFTMSPEKGTKVLEAYCN